MLSPFHVGSPIPPPPASPAASDPADRSADSRVAVSTIRPLIQEVAARHSVPAALVEAVIRADSGFDPRAVSCRGASGLMQLMPATAEQLGVRDVFDVRQNIEGGVSQLA